MMGTRAKYAVEATDLTRKYGSLVAVDTEILMYVEARLSAS